MKKLSILLKGIIVGFVSCAIPGVSASTFAIILGVYYTMIESISMILKNFKKSMGFLVFMLLGYAIGALLAAILVSTIYDKYPLAIVIIIICFIVGSLPNMIKDLIPHIKKVSGWIVFIVIVGLFIAYSGFVVKHEEITFVDMNYVDYIKLLIIGLITSITLVIPGMDFAVVLLSLGYYYAIMDLMKNLLFLNDVLNNLLILGTYLVGYGVGCFLLSNLIKKLVKKHEATMKFASFAFVVVSPYMIIKKCIIDNDGFYYSNGQLIVGIIIGIIALLSVMLMYRLTNKDDKRVNAMKKRNMLRFYFTLIRELPVTFYYLIKMKKMIKKQELTFEEKYAFCQKILAKVNKLGNVYPVVVGLENVDKNATLYIVNHQGRYDGICALSALKDFPCSFIADKKRICWPFYRELSTLLEAIELELDNPRSEIKALQEMSEGLINGRSYLAFIEGKYEDNGNNLQEFKTGVLKTAYRAKVKITPVVLYDTYLVYGKSSIKKISPEIHFLKPIEYEEFAEINRKELADIIKEKMQNEINIINTRKGV